MSHQKPEDQQHAFIVRVDGKVLESIEAHRKKLQAQTGFRLSRAHAVRHLLRVAFQAEDKRARPNQPGLFAP